MKDPLLISSILSVVVPFKTILETAISPLENCILTALSKPTDPTVIVFSPTAKACALPK